MKHFIEHLLVAMALILFVSSCYNEDNRIYPSCDDGILNQDEERIDCGGPCEECPPSCDNGVLDFVDGWQEHGIDCGGPCDEFGQFCCENGVQDIVPQDETLSENWVDCVYDVYPAGHPEAGQPITDPNYRGVNNEDCPVCDLCANGVHDGTNDEFIMVNGAVVAVIDCGGAFCQPCADLCDDGVINGGEGPCPDCGGNCPSCDLSYCTNGQKDEFAPVNGQPNPRNETGIDCGGCGCVTCPELCFDGILNGLEEAIDCGQESGCVACNDLSLCTDGIQNGYESGIDCYDASNNLSACESCESLCANGMYDGNELDIDCGGPGSPTPCPPCGTSEIFMTYKVDGVAYECFISSIVADTIVGDVGPPVIRDVLVINGGLAHSMTFNLLDDDDTPNTFDNSGDWVLSNSLETPGTASFTDENGNVFTSSVSQTTPFTVVLTELQYINSATVPGIISGTFSGRLSDGNGGTIQISQGMFSTNWNIGE